MEEKKGRQEKQKEITEKIQEENQMAVDRYVQLTHMKAWQAMQEKTELLLETAGGKKTEGGDGYFYDIPEYLIHVCQRLRSLVGGITETDIKYISLDIIYRIEPKKGQWNHIQANEKRMGTVYDEEKYPEKQNPVVMDVLKGKIHHVYHSVQEPEKNAFFCASVNFGGYGKRCADGCLLISVRGENFVRAEEQCLKQGKKFEDVLICFIMPYFIQLIENELGSMYLWKKYKRKKNKNGKNNENNIFQI